MARKPATQPDKQFGVRLTEEEVAFLRREKAATGARSLSAVVEEGILALVDEIEGGQGACLAVPTTGGRTRDDLLPRQFWFRVATFGRIEEVATRHGWTRQALARAALHRLARLAEDRERRGDAPDSGGG